MNEIIGYDTVVYTGMKTPVEGALNVGNCVLQIGRHRVLQSRS